MPRLYEGILPLCCDEFARPRTRDIHAPQVHELDGVTYCNTGDWVENCSALVETHDGQLALVHADHCAISCELMPSSDAVHDFTAAIHLTRHNTRGEWESLTAIIQSERNVHRTS